MISKNKPSATLFIVLELLLGVLLSFFLIKFALNNDDDDLWGKTIGDGIIRIYGALSLIFFFSVFLVGIIGAIRLKRVNKIGKAIALSILFWFLSLIISVFCDEFMGIFSLYIILIGIVVGFNLGLGHASRVEVKDSEISN